MKKKEALILLLQNSLIVTDKEKKKILHNFSSLSSTQIDTLGIFLSYEQVCLVENKDTLLKQAKLLMNTLELVSVSS